MLAAGNGEEHVAAEAEVQLGFERDRTALVACLLIVGAPIPAVAGEWAEQTQARDLLRAGKYAERKRLRGRPLPRTRWKRETTQSRSPRFSTSWSRVSRGGKGSEPESRRLAERAVMIKERVLVTTTLMFAKSRGNLGNLLRLAGEYAGARPLYERALAINEGALGPDHPDVATSLNSLAVLLRVTGDFAGAQPSWSEPSRSGRGPLDPNHPQVSTSLRSLRALVLHDG